MVKGTSRQVIGGHSPEPELFEQAIFILKDEAVAQGITEEALMKEAQRVLKTREKPRKHLYLFGAAWAAGGALLTGIAWLVTALI